MDIKDLVIKKLANSQLEISGELESEQFGKYWPRAIKEISAEVHIDGFRPGNAPESILVNNVGEVTVLEKAARLAFDELYPKIVIENKIDAIGKPEIVITKLARNNPMGFKIRVSIFPEFELPKDYKTIAKKIAEKYKEQKIEVKDEEVDAVIEQIRKNRGSVNNQSSYKKTTEPDDSNQNLPEFDDNFVKTLGKFEGVDDFKTKMRENLKEEKEGRKKEELRIEIIDTISEKTQIDPPRLLIESELDRITAEIKERAKQFGIKFEDYLKSAKKKESDIREENEKGAKKRVLGNLILKRIAEEEKIKPLVDEVNLEVQKILDYYKDADPESAKIYVEDLMINEKVFNFLERLE